MWASGLRGEECAAIYSHNNAQVLFCMLGMMRAGAVWIPINYRNSTDDNAGLHELRGDLLAFLSQ